MPRIHAATVAEHRARQRAALIRAAVDILVEQGAVAVTPAAVGARAGLARSSVYQYFPSSQALIASIVEDGFPRANQAIAAALAGAHTPTERIDVYIRQTLRLAAEGAHRPAAALARADLPPSCRARLVELHAEQAVPLVEAVLDLGASSPELTAKLIGGMLRAAMAAIERGEAPGTVTRRTLDLVHGGLNAS
ncbi:MAG: TetR/AcrR family transcriptional regulator [Dactylosporangium sp.]|nr:TetR/AcrR family transcriptional regulator [Dactylosporangium sp.]NNJ61667.1 TetR/AcrR family transcriptional regulator [Dactylosporangium sp.]